MKMNTSGKSTILQLISKMILPSKILLFYKNCHILILTKKESFFTKNTNYFTLPDIHNNRSISLHYSSYFTTSIFAVPSAKNEIPSASCFVYMVAVSTCSPSPTNTSTLKRSNIILNLSSPFGLLTRARR